MTLRNAPVGEAIAAKPKTIDPTGWTASCDERLGFNRSLGELWFVHGMLEDQNTWTSLIDRLDPGSACIPHFPWSARGGSAWGREASASRWFDAFRSARSSRPTAIVCHSFGCSAVLEHLLLDNGPQPDVLVLIAPFYCRAREEVTWARFEALVGGLERLIADSISVQDPRGRYSGWLGQEMALKVRDRLGVYGWFEFLASFLRTPDLPLSRLTARTLVISGERDVYSTRGDAGRLVEDLPNAQHLVVADSGHFLHQTHGDEIAKAIADFIFEGQMPGKIDVG